MGCRMVVEAASVVICPWQQDLQVCTFAGGYSESRVASQHHLSCFPCKEVPEAEQNHDYHRLGDGGKGDKHKEQMVY